MRLPTLALALFALGTSSRAFVQKFQSFVPCGMERKGLGLIKGLGSVVGLSLLLSKRQREGGLLDGIIIEGPLETSLFEVHGERL